MTAATATSTYTPRQMRALPGGAHDRLVATLRWLLPGLALALLALIIIWPLTNVREFSFLLAKDKVAMSPDRLRIDNALYRGETSNGQPFEIRAADAVQRTSAVPVVELRGLSAYLGASDGPVRVSAPAGLYDMDKDLLVVSGPVRVTSTAGYALDSGAVRISLLDRTVATDERISGHLPLGSFSADSLRGDIGGRKVVLAGNVRMRITPGKVMRASPGSQSSATAGDSLRNDPPARK
ncbi:MAG: LPS export ABC transporter periplasmic protein LptC [Polymorphobacter sp.]